MSADEIGYVYILSNRHIANLIKIGFTTKSVYKRAEELSSTGVPGSYKVDFYAHVENPQKLESIVHEKLSKDRDSKEFFRTSVKEAVKTIKSTVTAENIRCLGYGGKKNHSYMTDSEKRELEKGNIIAKKKQDARNKLLEDYRKSKDKVSQLQDKYNLKIYLFRKNKVPFHRKIFTLSAEMPKDHRVGKELRETLTVKEKIEAAELYDAINFIESNYERIDPKGDYRRGLIIHFDKLNTENTGRLNWVWEYESYSGEFRPSWFLAGAAGKANPYQK